MSSLLRKLRNLSGKDKDRSRSSSPAPSASRPSTSGESAINIDLVTGPIRHGPNENKKLYLAAGIAALQHLKEINEASDFLGPLKAAYGATTAILEMIKVILHQELVCIPINRELCRQWIVRRSRGRAPCKQSKGTEGHLNNN